MACLVVQVDQPASAEPWLFICRAAGVDRRISAYSSGGASPQRDGEYSSIEKKGFKMHSIDCLAMHQARFADLVPSVRALGPRDEHQRKLGIVDGLLSVTHRAWGLGLRAVPSARRAKALQ